MATSKNNSVLPFGVAHPTEIVREELKARGMTQRELASRMDMKPSNLNRFLKGENISPAIAAKLEVALDIPADFWLGLQAQYEVDMKGLEARDKAELEAVKVEKELSEFLNLPVLYKRLSFRPYEYVHEKLGKLEEMLGVPVEKLRTSAFVSQPCFKKNEKIDVDEKNQATWLALAYIESRKSAPEKPYQKGNALEAAQAISARVHSGELNESEIGSILRERGISYGVVSKLEKTPVDAVSMTVDGYPAIVTTHRYDDMSRLEFNVLHELGHIEKHMDPSGDSVFVASESTYSRDSKEEREANKFAEEMLIPSDVWKKMMAEGAKNLSSRSISLALRNLSKKYGLDPDIVAWRYKHEANQYGLFGIKAKPIV